MGRRILSCQRNKVAYRGKGHRLTMLKTTMGEVGYRRHVYLLSGEAERHVMTVYLLDKAMGLDTVGLFRYTACIMVVEAASIAQRGPAARPLREYGEQYLHHYWEPDEAQPHLPERGWSKQSGSLTCAASYRQTPARSARLGGAQQSGGQRFDRDAAAFCREG